MQKQIPNVTDTSIYKDLRYIFDTEDLLQKLDEALKLKPADLIVIDTFTDLFSGEMNASNKVRNFISDYSLIAKRHKCLVIFLHHVGKRTESLAPSKDNLLGSQGFEARMRLVIELKKDYENSGLRHLCIVKGNYLPEEEKDKSYVLKFDSNLLYSNLNKRVPFYKLVKPDPNKVGSAVAKAKAITLKQGGKSLREIETLLNDDGFGFKKSTIGNWVKNCPIVQPPLEEMESGQDEIGE